MVRGNHDYWYDIFDDSGLKLYDIDGFTIGACTFWTDLSKDPFAFQKSRGFSDFMFIEGMTIDQWQKRHEMDVEGLRANRPDIIVTHHAPSFQSVSEEFHGDSFNTFFVSDHDKLVKELDPIVWIHGHVHSTWNYHIDGTRILCNPLGYPGEIKHKVDVNIVEVA